MGAKSVWKIVTGLVFVISATAAVTYTEICYNVKDVPTKVCVRDYEVDVVLMFDQSGSVAIDTNIIELRKALKQWVESYFDIEGINKSQFAVLGCDPLHVYHKFSDQNFSKMVPKRIEQIATTNLGDNLDKCSDVAADTIFNEANGHRPNVINIALWITDCKFEKFDELGYDCKTLHLAAAKKLQVDKIVELFFVCCKSTTEQGFRIHNATYWSAALQWLGVQQNRANVNDFIILYWGSQKLSDSNNKLIPFKIKTKCRLFNTYYAINRV